MNIIDVRNTIPKSNYTDKEITPRGITFHITADSKKGQALNWFQNPNANVSSHYIVEPDGDIHLCVSPNRRAWHCGSVERPRAQIILDNYNINPNKFMIGIEVVSSSADIKEKQFEALKELTTELCTTYGISINRYALIGHNEINSIYKAFDPISSYSVNEIIKGIKSDKKIKELTDKISIMQIFKDDLELSNQKVDRLKEEYTHAERIVKKTRSYNKMLKKYIKKILTNRR